MHIIDGEQGNKISLRSFKNGNLDYIGSQFKPLGIPLVSSKSSEKVDWFLYLCRIFKLPG